MGIRLPTAAAIANIYTASQIQAKIAEYQDKIDAAASGGYRLDTTQGAQSSTPANPDQLMTLMSIWMKAYEIKTGTYCGARIINANYTP